MKTEVLIVGGGLGGVAAALAAARLGCRVVVTEETDWLGGQLTSQAVIMDEHPWIERFGCTASYRNLREGIRAYYRRNFPLTWATRTAQNMSTGASLTTRLPSEPRVTLGVLEEMLAPHRSNGSIRIFQECRPLEVQMDGDRARAVTLTDRRGAVEFTVEADYILDATERGDLLPLARIEYVTGAESREETGELHAMEGPAQPENMQAFTLCFAVANRPGEDHTIEEPREYRRWSTLKPVYQPELLFAFRRFGIDFDFFPLPGSDRFSIWQYRRIYAQGNFVDGYLAGDVSLINCWMNDYSFGSIVDVPPEEEQGHIRSAGQLSLSLLYWLQTEAPRPEGGGGYPELQLLPEYTDTRSGLAKFPYIREGRRINAEFTILEQHVGAQMRGKQRASERFADSVGIGCYRIDLHPTTGGQPPLNIPTRPFQIPLGALIPIRAENLLPACKNIGTTHITNGCYRLHPVEWNIGEAAGALAAHCLKTKIVPRQVRNTGKLLEDFQRLLERMGVELSWPEIVEGTSYHKMASAKPGWNWGETINRWYPLGS
jgi:hypothetical protein